MKQYPKVVSRTLDPSDKSLMTVVGQHDFKISDADINLIQDLQDFKRQRLLQDRVCSGALTYESFQFNPYLNNLFYVPTFDVLFSNEVITIGGANSYDLTQNIVRIPAPSSYIPGVSATEPAAVYVAFLEFWYAALTYESGSNYADSNGFPFDKDLLDNDGLRYYYRNGCVNSMPTNNIQNDTIDVFEGLETTQRAQIQWRINVQRVALAYDFSNSRTGLEPTYQADGVTVDATRSVYAQGTASAPVQNSAFVYQNLALIDGDGGLWRAGDGNVQNDLGTMDGYSYAMPLAVVFQYNKGVFDLQQNLFGCANGAINNSGILANPVSGRWDKKLADSVWADDVVDTRSVINLGDWCHETLLHEGFVDLITGTTRLAIKRGEKPGNQNTALGSTLSYNIEVSPSFPSGSLNADSIGTFDGYMNGFSSDQRTFYTTKKVTLEDKTSGQKGSRWTAGDTFVLPATPLSASAYIQNVTVYGLLNNPDGSKSPVLLLDGQIHINEDSNGNEIPLSPLTKSITVKILYDFVNTTYDFTINPLFVTLGVTYAANSGTSGMNLQKVPLRVYGGILQDLGRSLSVYAVSEYEVQVDQPALQVQKLLTYNSEYSELIFGTRAWVSITAKTSMSAEEFILLPSLVASNYTVQFDGTYALNPNPTAWALDNGLGTVSLTTLVSGEPVSIVALNRKNLEGSLSGLYVISAWNSTTPSQPYSIEKVEMAIQQTIVTLNGTLVPTSTTVCNVLCADTAQLVYNAPVMGVTAIEETVLIGNTSAFNTDSRVQLVSNPVFQPATSTTVAKNVITFAATDCILKGISGNDIGSYIWVQNPTTGNYSAVLISSMTISGGLITVTIPATVYFGTQAFPVNLDPTSQNPQKFFMIAAIYPSFASTDTLDLTFRYLPYQGEGVAQRNYEIMHSDECALVTTNGTGAAPIPGLSDVYPYNRELPVVTSLPTLSVWSDANLSNTALASFADNNYEAKRFNNVEHTFEVPVHTNDFIEPLNKDKRKIIQLLSHSGVRGFSTATPHVGFAIRALTPRTVLGNNLLSTTAPVTLYVDNVNGDDTNNGLSLQEAKQTVPAALGELPPVLTFPVSVLLVNNNVPYSLASMKNLQTIALGDGTIRKAEYFALGNLAFTIQAAGRLTISRLPNETGHVVISGTGVTANSNGPTSAFFVDDSRVLFNGLEFTGFTNPAIKGISSNIEIIDCNFTSCFLGGSFEQGCEVTISGGSVLLSSSETGFNLTSSQMLVSGQNLAVATGMTPGVFYVGSLNSSITLQQHSATDEVNVVSGTTVAQARINSSLVCDASFITNGTALLQMNSVLSRSVEANPFLGGANADASSNVVSDL